MSQLSSRRRRAKLPLFLVLAFFAGGLGGCKTASFGDITGSITGSNDRLPASQDGLRAWSEEWGRKFEADPGNRQACLNYGRGLKALSQFNQEAAVLQTGVLRHSGDRELLAAYGKALVDAGRLQEAVPVLASAHTPERPNWSVYSTQGSVADQLGNHPQAQAFYQAALEIVPGEPTVLSNLGLSYALSRQLPRAEETLRQAAADKRADSRVRQNLAMVLALQGKFAEAEEMSRRDMSAEEAKTNVASIRQMIAQSNTWREIQKLDTGRKARQAQPAPAQPVSDPAISG